MNLRFETTKEALYSLRKSNDPFCKEMADRIQAAVVRERASLLKELEVCSAEIGQLRMKLYSDSVQSSDQPGNAVKLRAACEHILSWLKRMNLDRLAALAESTITPAFAVNSAAEAIIEDNKYHISCLEQALATPPRNCDVYTTEESVDEACASVRACVGCPSQDLEAPCVFCTVRWLLAPAGKNFKTEAQND